jgi:hypothetical protein
MTALRTKERESRHLVCIARDSSDTFNSEVEQFCREPSLVEERHYEATETTIDVEANVVLLGNGSESNNVVHSTIWEVDGGTDDLEQV